MYITTIHLKISNDSESTEENIIYDPIHFHYVAILANTQATESLT